MEFAISQPKMVQLAWNEKQTYQLNSRLEVWPSGLTLAMTLTLNFQGQIWNLLYLNQKWSDCLEMKNKHIDWTQGFKCDHQVWPWPWPSPWIVKVKYIYVLTKNGLNCHETKSKHQLKSRSQAFEFSRSNVTLTFDLMHVLDQGFSWSNF